MSIPPPFFISNNPCRQPLNSNTTRVPMVPFRNSGTSFSNTDNNSYQFCQQNTNARGPANFSYPEPYNVNRHSSPISNASIHIPTSPYHASKSNPELIPTTFNSPRQPFINHISIPQSNMVNRFQNLPPYPPVVRPRLLSPEHLNVPNIHVQSPLRLRSEVPVMQNQSENTALQHSQISFNASFSQHMNTSNPNFTFHTPTINFQNRQPVTLNSPIFTNNVHQYQNVSMNNASSTFPTISESPMTAPANLLTMTTNMNNLVTLPGRTDTPTTIPSNYENNLLHPALPISIQVPPLPIPSIPLHLPPPVPNFDSPLNVPALHSSHLVCEKQMKLDRFILKFVKMNEKSSNISIPEFRSTLIDGFSISKELLHAKQNLTNLLQSDEDTWNCEMQRISDLKKKLSEICAVVSTPVHLKSIVKKLQIIKKKREQKKKTKSNKLSAKLKAEENRKERHQEIDKWFDDIKEKNLKLKREAEMKKEADFILLEVRKKIHEAKRTIEKLQVFEKLRSARQANAAQKGLHLMPEHNKNFENKVSVLKETMLNQLADYEAEERALKVMLETEQEGQLEEETRWKLKKVKALQQKRQKHIVECLFGDSDDPLPTDPLYLFHNYQMSANSSIESLAQIRHNWDIYLAEDGEALPQQWVIPTPASNSSWEPFLMNPGSKS